MFHAVTTGAQQTITDRLMEFGSKLLADLEQRREVTMCLLHPEEAASDLDELLEGAAPVLMAQRGLQADDGTIAGGAPTVLLDLSARPDLVDLIRVAAVESDKVASFAYAWHALRCRRGRFAVLEVAWYRPVHAHLGVGFAFDDEQVRRVLEEAVGVRWITLSSADGNFVLGMARLTAGLADTLLAVAEGV
jgi:hypothetical protein